jgi:hypothetical protein
MAMARYRGQAEAERAAKLGAADMSKKNDAGCGWN